LVYKAQKTECQVCLLDNTSVLDMVYSGIITDITFTNAIIIYLITLMKYTVYLLYKKTHHIGSPSQQLQLPPMLPATTSLTYNSDFR